MKIRYDSDMAIDLKDEVEFKNKYDYYEENTDGYKLEVIRLNEDNELYNKSKGLYISISFDDLDHSYQEIKNKLVEVLHYMTSFLKLERKKKVLICGLGNDSLACDCLGPLLKNKIVIHEIGHTFLLIPGVKGQTGIETYDLISAYISQCQPDIVLLVDALASKSVTKLNQVIQITDTGIKPGSGVGNHCLSLNKTTLHKPVICIGVPTVVRIINIAKDILAYFKIDEDIDLEEKYQQIVMDKSCDVKIKQIASLIADALNEFLDEE